MKNEHIAKARPLGAGRLIFSAAFFLAAGIAGGLTGGEASRAFPVQVNLIVDGSGAFSPVSGEALDWISRHIVDEILTRGDTITVWSAGEAAREVLSAFISEDADKEYVRLALLALPSGGEYADFSGALLAASAGARQDAVAYTLLISSVPSFALAFSGEGARFTRFSRVREFPGWRALFVGLDIEDRVRRAAEAAASALR